MPPLLNIPRISSAIPTNPANIKNPSGSRVCPLDKKFTLDQNPSAILDRIEKKIDKTATVIHIGKPPIVGVPSFFLWSALNIGASDFSISLPGLKYL